MAAVRIEMVLTTVFLMALWEGSVGQSSCNSAIIGMSPCLNYITGNSSTPSSSCCTQLAGVVSKQPQCLCEVLNGGSSSLGVKVNQTQALALPNACKVQTPPVSNCKRSSPSDSSSGTPTSPSGGGSTDGDSSDGNSTKLAFSLLFFLLFIASYASTSMTN